MLRPTRLSRYLRPTLALLILAAGSGLAAPPAAHAQKLVRDYKLEETLKDDTNQGPELKSLNGNLGFKKYTFDANQGLRLEKAGVRDHYTVEITFRFGDISSWQKILDFKGGSSDNGLYVLDGKLQFYDFGIGGDFQADHEYRVRLERDKSTNVVTAYLDDNKVFDFTDVDGHGIFDTDTAIFFVDDSLTNMEEASPGVVTRIRIWDAPGGK